MTETRGQTSIPPPLEAEREVTGWVGWVYFAGIMMITLGVVSLIQGLVALLNSSYYLVPAKELALSVSYTGWGWTHLVLGIVVAVAGAALLAGKTWARVVAIVVAVFSAVVNLVFIAAYPWWGAIVIALDVLVVYAVAVHGREMQQADY